MPRNHITQIDNPIKYCRDCGCELILDINWTEYLQRTGNYICKNCQNKKVYDWMKSHPKYDTNKWKKNHPKKSKNWLINNPNYYKNWRDANPNYMKDWHTSNPHKRSQYESKRCRNLEWIELFDNPFPEDIPVVGHHISDAFVVYIPEDLHISHYHGRNTKLHRNELKPIIEDLYNISYIIKKGG